MNHIVAIFIIRTLELFLKTYIYIYIYIYIINLAIRISVWQFVEVTLFLYVSSAQTVVRLVRTTKFFNNHDISYWICYVRN